MSTRNFAGAVVLCSLVLGPLVFAQTPVAGGLQASGPGLGTPISEADIAPWDISILPDGTGLPAGSGTPQQGATIFATKCAVCHGEMKGTERTQGRMFWMDSCMACHLQNGASNACETCHLQVRQDVAPESHHHLWKERHGDLARSKLERQEGRCDLCHTQPQWCEKCHREEPPKSHTNLWRQRTHGVMAAIDRTSCQTCHTTDYCQRCHMETEPRSHRSALWEGTVNTHCAQCHFPIRLEESCRICHRQDPQHDTAPDMPSWHLPSMNCRSCHTPTGGGAPPLLHVDNGMQCTFCHN